jgi:type II secretory pathway component PulF
LMSNPVSAQGLLNILTYLGIYLACVVVLAVIYFGGVLVWWRRSQKQRSSR